MTSLTLSDYRVLRDLAARWRESRRSAPFAGSLDAVLDEISARRTSGPDFLAATVGGDSIPEMESAALAKAAELYGTAAKLEVVNIGTVGTWAGRWGKFAVTVTVRCLNYAEITP